MRKLAILFAVSFLALPFLAQALVTCEERMGGCSAAEYVQLASGSDVTTTLRIQYLQKAIAKLTEQIGKLKSGNVPAPSSCLDLNNALVIGSTDATTNGEVSRLQRFLGAYKLSVMDPGDHSGIPPEELQPVTGYYGTKTAANVMQWQKANGMDFVTLKSGVGPMTRAKMACGQPVAQCSTYESKPVITSITPSSGPIGTTIEVRGCNFLAFEGDKILWFTNSKGEKGVLNGQMDAATRTSNTVLRVTLAQKICQYNSYSGLDCPLLELAPGAYTIYSNSYGGNSNAVNFTVTQQ